MKKTTITMLCLAACLAAADTKITWLADVTADRAETVTGVQSNQIRDAAAHIVRTDNPHGVTAVQIGALTAEQDLAALAALAAYAATGKVTRLDGGDYFMTLDRGTSTVWKIEGPYTHLMIRLEPDFIDTATQTRPAWTTHTFPVSDEWGEAKVFDAESFQYSFNKSDWTAAWFGVGDGTFPVTLYPESGTASGTATIYESAYYATNIAFRAASTTDISAALAALAAYAAYWPPNATASSRFNFVTNSGAITITGYSIAGGGDVVIPDYINGLPVTEIGANAFDGSGVTSIGGAGNVVTVGASAFTGCASLASVSLPQVQTVGDYAFGYCGVLTSLYFDNDAPAIEAEIFAGITANQVTNYVTNPTATGWGEKLGDMPVVRLPLYADAIYQAGELVATEAHVAEQIAAIEFPVASTNYTAWTGTVTPVNGTATVAIAHGNMPVLVTDAPCVLTLDPTGFGTAGVSRVSLSYYPGTNSFTFATNIIKYAETPTVDTNGWNTLLIRRVSDGAWKGVGL